MGKFRCGHMVDVWLASENRVVTESLPCPQRCRHRRGLVFIVGGARGAIISRGGLGYTGGTSGIPPWCKESPRVDFRHETVLWCVKYFHLGSAVE